MLSDIITNAIQNLGREGIRTFLTLIGIVIGIAAIVSLLSVGQGLSVAVEKQFESIGSNTVFIEPGNIYASAQQVTTLPISDVDLRFIKNIRGVNEVGPMYMDSVVAEVGDKKVPITLFSTDAENIQMFADTGFFNLSSGRLFEENESSSIVLGETIAKKYFDKELKLRQTIKLNGQEFKIIGLIGSESPLGGVGGDLGSIAYISSTGYEKLGGTLHPTEVMIVIEDASEADRIAEEIRVNLEKKYGEKSVTVLTAEETLELVNSIFGLITVFLAGIAAISLIVGGIGIANAMITSVLERKQEIGLMKALGASNFTVLLLVMLESAFIGIVGGVIGLLVGYGLSLIISIAATASGFELIAYMDIGIITIAIGFSVIVGVASGFYPALWASNLDPVEALKD